MRSLKRLALVYGAPAGVGGLGVQVANAIQGLAIEGVELHAFGPGHAELWPLPCSIPKIFWHDAPSGVSQFRARYTSLRWRHGQLVLENSGALGSWAALQIARLQPDFCYLFTQVGLESLKWAARASIPTVLRMDISVISAASMTKNPRDGAPPPSTDTPMPRWSSESRTNIFSPHGFESRPNGRGARCNRTA